MIPLSYRSNYRMLVLVITITVMVRNVYTSETIETPVLAEPIKSVTTCGGIWTTALGVIQTPNFPAKFPVPIRCTWIIDASEHHQPNSSIIVYLTQQFVLGGLKFTEYIYYKDGYKIKSEHKPFELNEQTVTQVPWIQFYSPFLEIQFTMDNLYGSHLRALDRLLDVYGFNITYEIDVTAKQSQCNALLCRYLGHCYATSDFSSYYCSCFNGFSGSDCGNGPLCREGDKNFCENGGSCKQIGDAGVTCLCPKGFKGRKCQTAEEEDVSGCFSDDENCDSECHFSGPEHDRCKCTRITSISNRERAKFEATVRLGNTTYSDNRRRPNENLPTILEKHVNRLMRNSNITRITDLEVVNLFNSESDVKIQFFGERRDGARIRDAFQKLLDRIRLGNITLVPSMLSFHDEAVLQIESVSVNYKTAVRHNAELKLSCEARGSPNMIFRWFKNGIYVNQTKATRKIWSRIYVNSHTQDHYTALLGVPKASRLDEGIYTCQVSDYGMQQCRSTVVHISTTPELRLDPPSATVYRGDSVRIRCLSSDVDQTNGYSWTKNNALFHSDAETELWEDLYPIGSILKINNIQKSANYTCVSSNAMGQVSKSVYVYVVDKGTIELCSNDTSFSVKWPASSPGLPILVECPKRYEGQAQRICEQRDFGKPVWLTPNFSGCLAHTLVDVLNEFRGLTFSYQKTNGSVLLKSCLEYAKSRNTNFLPGEAGFLLKLLQEVNEYLTERGSEQEQESAADYTLQIIDVVLKSEHSLNNQQQVEMLQSLVKSATLKRELFTTMKVPVSAPSTSLHYHQTGSFWTHKQYIKSLPFTSQVNGDHLFSDQLYAEMAFTPMLQEIISNGSMMLSIISYKNLTNFLPRMYFERSTNAPDIDYMTASRVIASWLVYANRTLDEEVVPTSQLLHLPTSSAHVEILFHHENPPNSDWTPVCGYDLQATFKATWNTDLCITESLTDNATRCVCPLSGTYIVLMAKRSYNSSTIRSIQHPMFVVVGCGCCFLQACIALGILMPVLFNRKCSVTFLKMQFSTATSMAMALFAFGFLQHLPTNWHGVISSTLGGILLLGSSTLIAITLAIDSELGPRKSPTANLSSGMRGTIGLSWFLPILYIIITLLIYTVMGNWPTEWWLTVNTIGFVLFVIIELLFVILFSLLFYTLMHKLNFLAKKHDKHNSTIAKRIGLAYRVMCLLVLKTSTDISYLIYSNSTEIVYSYIFGALSICLGFTLFICFVIKAESKVKFDALNKANGKQIIDDYCSGSINSPLNYYTNHDIGKENDCAVPATQSATTKLPLAITTRRYPMEHLTATLSAPANITDPYITTGGLCETRFLELKDQSANLDVNFIEFKQQQQQQQQLTANNMQQQSSQYPTLLDARNYEMEIMPTELSLYGSCKPSQGKCYLNDTNDFVGVSSLDILQGVRQDSIIGIRSNYNDQIVKSNMKSDLSTIGDGLAIATTSHQYVNQSPMIFDSNPDIQSPQKKLETANVQTLDGNKTLIVPGNMEKTSTLPPTITVTSTDETNTKLDGMLDRISHDLDYLLNRFETDNNIPPVPPPPISSVPIVLRSHPNRSVHEVIIEEEPDET